MSILRLLIHGAISLLISLITVNIAWTLWSSWSNAFNAHLHGHLDYSYEDIREIIRSLQQFVQLLGAVIQFLNDEA